jgi:hypothetical protein
MSKPPKVHTRGATTSPHTSRGIFHQVDRLEALHDHGQHDAAPRDPDEDEEDEEEEDRADEPPVVREPDEDS